MTEPGQNSARPQADEVAARAYQIWDHEGRPDGHDVDHWLQARTGVAVGAGAKEARAQGLTQTASRTGRAPEVPG
ncbi:DUF2934 domain-containing protein [Phenylobacterium soli]